MAARKVSLVEELLQVVSPMPYKTFVTNINEREDALSPDTFKNSRWANYFAVDTSQLVTNGRANPSHVYDLFGSFSGNNGSEVRVKLLQHIIDELNFYEIRSRVCLQAHSIDFETWVETISKEHCYCDELALIGLCHLYHCHCVVLTSNKMWSTIQANHPMKLLEVLNECTVRLIYLGNLRFGVLTWKPRLPKKVATKSPSFNIVEEYTLDKEEAVQNLTGKSAQVHVGTSSSSVQPISAGITPTCPTSNVTQSIAEQGTTQPTAIQGGVPSISTSVPPDPSTRESSVVTPSPAFVDLLHVETVDQCTATIESDEYVPNPTTHPADAIVLSGYPWRRAPSIKTDIFIRTRH